MPTLRGVPASRIVDPMRWAVYAILAAGCGRVGFGTGIDSDAPSGDADPDNDGIDIAVDNCPTLANADQDDEDNDGLGDVCDPCPPFPDNPDPDGDGVGGACDPNPADPIDRIVRFAGFERMPAGLDLVGAWTLSGGQIHVTGALNSEAAATWPVTGARETVSTHVTIDAMFGTGVARPIGVVHQYNEPTSDGIMCVFGINPSDLEVFAIASNATTSALQLVGTTAMVGSSATFSSTRTDTAYRCAATGLATPMMASDALASPANNVGLFARSSSASYDWVLIVTSD